MSSTEPQPPFDEGDTTGRCKPIKPSFDTLEPCQSRSADHSAGYCWHSEEAYDYPPAAGIYVHPHGWVWNNGENYAWREHPGRGYWQGDAWRQF